MSASCSEMWPMETEFEGYDLSFIIRFIRSRDYLLSTYNKRYHGIIAWCNFVEKALYDREVLRSLRSKGESSNLPWLSSDALDRAIWIPSAILSYRDTTEDNIVLRLKTYYQLQFKQTFCSGKFHPERQEGKGVILVSDKDNQSVESLFGLGMIPTIMVELTEEVYSYLLYQAGYEWLLCDTRGSEMKYFALSGPVTLAITMSAKENSNLVFNMDNNLYRNYIYYNLDRVICYNA